LLSPTNKVPGSFGRESFLQKRKEVMASGAHWIEIDLLRGGERTANPPGIPDTDYQVYLSRAGKPRRREIWPISIRDRLPVIAVPLRTPDADVPLDLQAALTRVIERGSYDLDHDYSADPVPPIDPATKAWARELIAARSKTEGESEPE
jgi:hypothetical protein